MKLTARTRFACKQCGRMFEREFASPYDVVFIRCEDHKNKDWKEAK